MIIWPNLNMYVYAYSYLSDEEDLGLSNEEDLGLSDEEGLDGPTVPIAGEMKTGNQSTNSELLRLI